MSLVLTGYLHVNEWNVKKAKNPVVWDFGPLCNRLPQP